MARNSSDMGSRALRYGAILMIIGSIEFLAGMTITQLAFPCTVSCYNMLTNPISDLGNTFASTLWPVFNYSLALFGVIIIISLLLVGNVFGKASLYRLGLLFAVLAALGGMGVALVPENTILAVHSDFALISFWSAGLLMLILGLAMRSRKGWGLYSAYSIVSGLFSIVTLLIFMLPILGVHIVWNTSGPGFGFGGMERLVVAPLILWLIVIGLRLLHSPIRRS